ncbi:MAG: hypothetical protein QM613_04485 [Micrococcaceae bacterium]
MNTTTPLQEPTNSTPLTANDRCDQCGAQAYVRATLNSGSSLLFCAHHAKQHEAQLKPIAASWQDETNLLHPEM